MLARCNAPSLLGRPIAAVIRAVEALVQHHLAVYFLVRLVAEGTGAAVCGLMQSELGYRLLAVTRVREELAQSPTAGV